MESKMLNYFKRLSQPSLDRSKDKYYPEIQQLAYNLVRYLKMNEDVNEHDFQGNHNLTYLIENMTDADFEFVVTKFLRSISFKRLRELIEDSFSKDSYDIIFERKELKEQILNFQQQLDVLKEKLDI